MILSSFLPALKFNIINEPFPVSALVRRVRLPLYTLGLALSLSHDSQR